MLRFPKIAESLQQLNRREFIETVRDSSDHQGIEGIARFQTSCLSKEGTTFFRSHVKRFFKRDRSVSFRLIKHFVFGQLHASGNLAVYPQIGSPRNVTPQANPDALICQGAGPHDPGQHIVGGIRTLYRIPPILFHDPDILILREDEMGSYHRPVS